MEILREVDPFRSNERPSRNLERRHYYSNSPNETWHFDGYIKLWIPIHGCIDAFSQKIIWLNVCRTNANFIQSVQYLKFCPYKVQTDFGTENEILAEL